jgi:hypothetical protein
MKHPQNQISIAEPRVSALAGCQRGRDQRVVLAEQERTTDGRKSESVVRYSQKRGNNTRSSETQGIVNRYKLESKRAETTIASRAEIAARNQSESRRRRRKHGRRKVLRVGEDKFLPKEAHLKAFQAAGLPIRGFWTMSQRNRARLIGQSEPEPRTTRIR